jgi:hypothetical protein
MVPLTGLIIALLGSLVYSGFFDSVQYWYNYASGNGKHWLALICCRTAFPVFIFLFFSCSIASTYIYPDPPEDL